MFYSNVISLVERIGRKHERDHEKKSRLNSEKYHRENHFESEDGRYYEKLEVVSEQEIFIAKINYLDKGFKDFILFPVVNDKGKVVRGYYHLYGYKED